MMTPTSPLDAMETREEEVGPETEDEDEEDDEGEGFPLFKGD